MNMQDVAYTLTVLDRGMERARLLWNGQAPWTKQKGRKIYGMYSALDGPVQPYGVNVPDSYDGSKLVRLYVWLHGRNAGLSEGNFIYTFTGAPPSQASTMNSANVGQIQLDVYGRWNNGYNWASEVDVAEAIAAVKRALSPSRDQLMTKEGFQSEGTPDSMASIIWRSRKQSLDRTNPQQASNPLDAPGGDRGGQNFFGP